MLKSNDIISINNSNHLEIVDHVENIFVYVKSLQYDTTYIRKFNISQCKIATDEQICQNLSEWVKESYLENSSKVI